MKVFLLCVFLIFSVNAESISPLPSASSLSSFEKAPIPFDIPALKLVWKARVKTIHAGGRTSFN